MSDLQKRVRAICEGQGYQNFVEKDDHFGAFRSSEKIYFKEQQKNIFELRKTGVNNIGDVRTWWHSYSYLTSDEDIIAHINWLPLKGLTIDLAKSLINREIEWKHYNFLNKDEAAGIAIIRDVKENELHPLEVQNINGDDLGLGFYDSTSFWNKTEKVINYRNLQSYIAFKDVE